MCLKAKSLVGWWTVPVLLVASLAAADSDLRLVEAAKSRDTQSVRALLEQQADVNTPQADGATALHWVAHWDDVQMADLLFRAGINVNAANDYGVTPLSLACTNGSAAMVEKLLGAGADPNAALPTGETALMTAARTGKVDAVNALLTRGADVHARERWKGQTALMWAAAEGQTEVALALIEHGADVRARSTAGFTPLLFAARNGDLSTTRVLLAAGLDVNEAASDGTTALVVATIRGYTAFAKSLLSQGANPNVGPGYTPLHWAAGEWETAMTTTIADDSEWSTLGGLRGQARLDFVKLLLSYGADPHVRVMKTPRAHEAKDVVGATPFLLAAMAGDVSVMRVLVASGADPLVTTKQQTTALMLAAGLTSLQGVGRVTESDALETVILCLELDGDVNAAGETALQRAVYKGANSIIQFLVDNGANVNAQNKVGQTPLTIAEGSYRGGSFNILPDTAALLRKLGGELGAEGSGDIHRPRPVTER